MGEFLLPAFRHRNRKPASTRAGFHTALLGAACLLLSACRDRPRAGGPCGEGEVMVNGICVDYRPVCAELEGRYLTYPSEQRAIAAGATKLADGECCDDASDCVRRGASDQRCVARTDPSSYLLEAKEDWFQCLTGENDVRCQCGGPNGAPICQFTTFDNPKFMACYARHLPNPPPDPGLPPATAPRE